MPPMAADSGASAYKAYARDAKAHGRSVHVSHSDKALEQAPAEDDSGGGAAMYKKYAKDAKSHHRAVHVSHSHQPVEKSGVAQMYPLRRYPDEKYKEDSLQMASDKVKATLWAIGFSSLWQGSYSLVSPTGDISVRIGLKVFV